MQKFRDVVQKKNGDVVVGANIAVAMYPSGAATTIYSDNGITPITSLVSDDDGEFEFYAPNGRYKITITGVGISVPIVINDILLYDGDDVDIREHGSVVNGGDITSALLAAIAYAESVSAPNILLPFGVFNYTQEALVSKSNINIIGSGADNTHNIGSQGALANTILQWAGLAGATMLRFASPIGASNQKQSGGGVSRIYFRANGAAKGLDILSWNSGNFSELMFEEFTSRCLSVGCVSTLGEGRDSQQNRFSRIGARQQLQVGTGIYLEGLSGANTSMNVFENIDIVHANGHGYELRDADNNIFNRVRAFRAGGGSGSSMILHGSDTSSGAVARANIFRNFSANTPVVAKGTPSYTYPSRSNHFVEADADNSTPYPTVETGANVYWSDTDGHIWNRKYVGMSIGADESETNIAYANRAATTALHVVNGSDSHVVLANNLGDSWKINVNSSTGELNITRLSGTGVFTVNNRAYIGGTSVTANLRASTTGVGFFTQEPVGKPTVTGSRGGNAALQSLLQALAGMGLVTDTTTA